MHFTPVSRLFTTACNVALRVVFAAKHCKGHPILLPVLSWTSQDDDRVKADSQFPGRPTPIGCTDGAVIEGRG